MEKNSKYDFNKTDNEFNHEEKIPCLRFSPEGQLVFDQWRERLENRLRGDHGLSPSLESHLTKYRKLMPALALIFHLINYADGRTTSLAVSEEAALMAEAWCDYLETHAKRVYGSISISKDVLAAKELAKHIQKKQIYDRIPTRDILRKNWSLLSTIDEVNKALSVLEDHHWVMIETSKPGPNGGRPSQVVRLNPKLKIEGDL
jgi:hypothetical protein